MDNNGFNGFNGENSDYRYGNDRGFNNIYNENYRTTYDPNGYDPEGYDPNFNGGYDPKEIYRNDPDVHMVLNQLINGTYSPDDPERFRHLYNSLLNTESTSKADTYFILKDFKSYAAAQKEVEKAYNNRSKWAESAILNVACSGKFTSDRTIQEYVDDIWHLDKVVL